MMNDSELKFSHRILWRRQEFRGVHLSTCPHLTFDKQKSYHTEFSEGVRSSGVSTCPPVHTWVLINQKFSHNSLNFSGVVRLRVSTCPPVHTLESNEQLVLEHYRYKKKKRTPPYPSKVPGVCLKNCAASVINEGILLIFRGKLSYHKPLIPTSFVLYCYWRCTNNYVCGVAPRNF